MKLRRVVAAALILAAPAWGQSPGPAKKSVAAKVSEVLEAVKTDADLANAKSELLQVFDEVIAFCPSSEADAFREAAFGVRLATQLCEAPQGRRADLLAFLRKNDTLAQALVFLVKPEDKIPAVYRLLDQLRERHKDLGDFPSLAAAVCVVHDEPLSVQLNENKVTGPGGPEVFDFFRAMKKQLAGMPPELLISVVDVAASSDELRWASSRYAGDQEVGKRYFDIKYDTDSYLKGAAKKVTAAGYGLQSILKHGGVCIDQAYFAAQLGKSIGVPTALITGRNAEIGHAWVGYLDRRAGRAGWNFDSGHYEGYQGVRGETVDPQTRRRVPDSTLALLADASTANSQNRRAAIAITDATLRLAELAKGGAFPPAEPEVITGKKQARTTAITDRLALLEAGLRRCPAHAPGWAVIVRAAKSGELSHKDKKRWAEVLDKLCAGKYPDFSLDILRPMVETVEDPKEQSSLWDSLFSSFQKRSDLAAEIRFAQGAMWEKHADRARAWDCYQDVIRRFADDGPFTVDAARRCERLLKDSGKKREVTPLYAALWPRLSKPASQALEIRQYSNWFRVGMLYAAALEADGDAGKAHEVHGKLGVSWGAGPPPR